MIAMQAILNAVIRIVIVRNRRRREESPAKGRVNVVRSRDCAFARSAVVKSWKLGELLQNSKPNIYRELPE